MKRILACSSSRVANSGYLEKVASFIERFLGHHTLDIAFIPFAAVDKNYERYVTEVRKGLIGLNHRIHLAEPSRAIHVIESSDAIMVGGGNTFKLLHDLYSLGLLELIRYKVSAGTPYIGWSAGSNLASPTICTTNDMPIIEPRSFKALALLPFQVNPHYINIKIEGQHGETRDQRLHEFMILNPKIPVVGLPEGTALELTGGTLTLTGGCGGVLFQMDENSGLPLRKEIEAGTDLSFLL